MVKKRELIPGDLTDLLVVANRHTCCICRRPRHPVEKYQIDENPSNNEWNNVAVVCRNCRRLISAKGHLGARYAPGEVLRYKLDWEQRCAEAGEDDIDSPVEEIHETRTIEGDSHEIYVFEMDEGDELVFSIEASDPLDVVLYHEEDAEAWSDGEVDEEEKGEDDPLPAGYMHLTAFAECRERIFTAPEDGRYGLLLVNWDDESTEVTIDAAVWEVEE